MPPTPRTSMPCHVPAFALELVLSVVDVTRVNNLAPHCYCTFWGSAHSDSKGPRAPRLLQMSTVDPQVHAESAHVVADCFLYMNPDEDVCRNIGGGCLEGLLCTKAACLICYCSAWASCLKLSSATKIVYLCWRCSLLRALRVAVLFLRAFVPTPTLAQTRRE